MQSVTVNLQAANLPPKRHGEGEKMSRPRASRLVKCKQSLGSYLDGVCPGDARSASRFWPRPQFQHKAVSWIGAAVRIPEVPSCGNNLTSRTSNLSENSRVKSFFSHDAKAVSIEGIENIRAAKKGTPPITPAVITPSGPTDLSTLLLRNRIVFVGSPVNSQVAQRVISQLLTLAAIDENEEIKMYINCPGGSTYSVLAIYDTMAWIKPKVSTVCFGIAASQGALLLAGGEKGRRFAMPNARIMIHQPQGGCGGTADDVRRQVNEIMQSRDVDTIFPKACWTYFRDCGSRSYRAMPAGPADSRIGISGQVEEKWSRKKIDKMYVAFTGQPLERVQNFTDRDRFFSASEAMEFGLIDGLLETEY